MLYIKRIIIIIIKIRRTFVTLQLFLFSIELPGLILKLNLKVDKIVTNIALKSRIFL